MLSARCGSDSFSCKELSEASVNSLCSLTYEHPAVHRQAQLVLHCSAVQELCGHTA